jgi:hypothetical protein
VHRVLNVLVCHQSAENIERLLAQWRRVAPKDAILLAHGGKRADFVRLEHPNKVFINDTRLRTSDHQRERQTYQDIWRTTSEWLDRTNGKFEFVYVAEYDHLPLVNDLNDRQINFLENERADVTAYHLQRIDQTSHPHYLYHIDNPNFHSFFAGLSRRSNKLTILSMLGTGSFWTREAFDSVAAVEDPFPIYTEIYLPSLAHHLGFRVRDFGEQNRFVHARGNFDSQLDSARKSGAWTLHPVKKLLQ